MGKIPLAKDPKGWATNFAEQNGRPETSAPLGNQRNQIAIWETDEHLGDQTTIAMILYSNKNFPNQKSEYPVWTERIKQLAKTWKDVPNDQRQPYVEQARSNRTARRMNNRFNDLTIK